MKKVNPKGPNTADAGSNRIYRGGSWFLNDDFLVVFLRSLDFPGNRSGDIGLRIACNGRKE